jgi:hypothetical protein
MSERKTRCDKGKDNNVFEFNFDFYMTASVAAQGREKTIKFMSFLLLSGES